MGCDFPFGLPRAFVDALRQHGPGRLPEVLCTAPAQPSSEASQLITALHQHCGDRAGFQRLIDEWGQTWHTHGDDAPRAGHKLLHRRTDQAMPGVSSTSPLQTRYVPVGKMYFEGLHRLVAADVSLPGLHAGRPRAIALEAYPGLLAHELLGRRSYKTDAKTEPAAQQARLIARMESVGAKVIVMGPYESGKSNEGLTDVHQLVTAYAAHAGYEEKEFLPLSQTILGRNSNHMAALGLSLHMRHTPLDIKPYI